MTVNRFFLSLLMLCIPAVALGGPETAEHRYLVESFDNYGAAVERCELLQEARPLPNEQTLTALGNYDIGRTRVFLVSREYYLNDQCAKDELFSLLLAVKTLEPVELQPVTEQVLQGIRGMLFTSSRWQLEKQYRSLPVKMRRALETLPYFQEPFDSLAVIDLLEK